MMKKIFVILLLALLPFAVDAQDARQRTVETIVADGLAQLPAQKPEVFNQVISELAATGTRGIEMMAGMLVPAATGKNATVEYALDGTVSYVTGPGREALVPAVRAGLKTALVACTDKANQAFLLSLLRMCATIEDAPIFVKYASDDYLADYAVRGLISTPGTEQVILSLIEKSATPNKFLAYAAAEKRIAAEPFLLKWAADASTDAGTKQAIYNALSKCGGKASLAILAAGAKAADYSFDKNDVTEPYLNLLKRLAIAGDAKAIAAAKSLIKATDRQNIRAAGLEIVLNSDAKKQMQNLLAATKDANREYRAAALDYACAFANDALYAALVKQLPSLDNTAKADVIAWLGTHHAESARPAVITAIASPDKELALTAIRAAGKLGGQEAMNALIAQLGGQYAMQASAALAAFNGNIAEGLVTALDGNATTQAYALDLIARRRVVAATDKVFALLNSTDKEVRAKAYNALSGVTTVKDFDRLCTLLDKAQEADVKPLQAGLKNALASEVAEAQYQKVAAKMASATQKARYYPLLAQAANREAIDALLAADNRDAAFAALLTVQNPAMIEVLYTLAQQNPAWTDAAISRYADFVVASAEVANRPALYRRGLEAKPSANVQNKLLRALAATYALPAIETAAAYLNAPETAESAAYAVKTIAAKNPGVGGEQVVDALQKSLEIYTVLAKSDADAGYAVDEIKGLLARYAAAPRFELSAEEKAAGFEVLFDGISMEKWTGSTDNYVPIDGTIYVTAQYGGQLYTKKEYSDFVLRFEFAFDHEGVNNGIGIRTPMGVDAAFEGMEIQILDHDNPIYKDIAAYQQHGSVYGVIAAKRVKFPALGEWNVEEIRAVGDQITVTVNGEVILDGNIREACKGHNVGAKGETGNPHMIDHRNHPGLFNKSGHIGLLGHGPGIKFRNLRIQEIGTPAKKK